ncbi:PTS sugar transporter subunit IIA [Palleronia caenipelagi]|uniref:PTS fructose transporter subunit IIA n=1 Tax=Palleronia caenipelagi TaxID=2489174 RepID=A0A547QB09_9RHOB|nr:PTS fructose transporter subunit IIA [Palleronia caenipelagi]TRD23569.1 PTS fructose transporter subunit IIA [Palleronia caenipelagi]
MIGIVIVAHGGLAGEFLASVEHVVGTQPSITAISIAPECDRSAKQREICAAADLVDTGSGVVIATDMFGGSPSNLSLAATCKCDRRIIYGVNLPLLIKLAKSRHLPIADAVAVSLVAGRKYLDAVYTPQPDLRMVAGQE